MRIGHLGFPADLIEAHRAGKLVIFVGAGASISPPSGLPSFGKLVTDIAAEVQREPLDGMTALDQLLGEMTLDDIDVDALVARHIDKHGSKPDSLHEALVDLTLAGGSRGLSRRTTTCICRQRCGTVERTSTTTARPPYRWATISPASSTCTVGWGDLRRA
jgi:hypothetical protein